MSILFIKRSPNRNGNTATLAKAVMGGKEVETLNLTDYRIMCMDRNYRVISSSAVIALLDRAIRNGNVSHESVYDSRGILFV